MNQSKNANNRINPYINRFETVDCHVGGRVGRAAENASTGKCDVIVDLIREDLNKGSRSCCRERERGREDESRELCPGDVDSGARSC